MNDTIIFCFYFAKDCDKHLFRPFHPSASKCLVRTHPQKQAHKKQKDNQIMNKQTNKQTNACSPTILIM